MYTKSEISKQLLQTIDIIVDGQFEIEHKVTDLAFRGSTNQRKIDVQKSLQKGETVRLKFGDENRYETNQPKIMYFQEFKKIKKDLTKQDENNTISMNFNQIDPLNENPIEPERITERNVEESIVAKSID